MAAAKGTAKPGAMPMLASHAQPAAAPAITTDTINPFLAGFNAGNN